MCDETRFINMSYEAGMIGITNSSFCPPKDFKFNLSGSLSVRKATFIEIEIDYCTQEYLERKYPNDTTLKCKSKNDSNTLISDMDV